MPRIQFPDPEVATPEGIVAIEGDLEPDTLLTAYRQGIFPWPAPGLPLIWFCPPERALLFFEEIHISRSLKKAQARSEFTFTINQDFDHVIKKCASVPRPDPPPLEGAEHLSDASEEGMINEAWETTTEKNPEEETWLIPEMIEAYQRLHRLGHAHSIECRLEGTVVGGIYGVETDGVFSAESMYYEKPNASKLALLYLVDHLKKRGLQWIDIQIMSPHMEKMGARMMPRKEFLKLLKKSRNPNLLLFD